MRIGIKAPNTGPAPAQLGMAEIGHVLESAGADSVWVSDHIVMPRHVGSSYPFAQDHRVSWSTEVDWYDAIIAMAQLIAATERVRVGVAVLVLPLRHPIEFAKQIASIAAQRNGSRLVLGVGAGWMSEEFDALGVPFPSRGSLLEEWIELAHRCWTGYPSAFEGSHYRLPEGMVTLPRLDNPPPFLIGGGSRPALRRAGQIANGWLGHYDLPLLDVAEITRNVATVRAAHGGPDGLEFPLRVVKTEGTDAIRSLARRIPDLRAAGITEVIVDLAPDDEMPDAARDAIEVLRNA